MKNGNRIPVLTVINGLDAGGAEGHLLRVLPRLDSTRFAVALLTLRGGGALAPYFAAQGVRVIEGHGGRASGVLRLAKEILQLRPIVHCFLAEAYLLGAPLALALGAKKVVMSRRSRNHYQQRYPFAAWVERRLHPRMDALVGNSRAVLKDLLDEGAPRSQVRLIYNGIDAADFYVGGMRKARRTVVRSLLAIPESRVVLVCVANLFHYKGHADLIAAVGSLGDVFSNYCTLLLVGRDAGARALLEAQVADLGLNDSVRFLGERNDVSDILAASDIGVLASHEEGFSNAVLEAMAAGLPMVVTDVGGNAEAVIDGECGYLVPAHDPTELAASLSGLIRDPALRCAMGDLARQRVAQSFSIDACVAAYEALYEEIWKAKVSPER